MKLVLYILVPAGKNGNIKLNGAFPQTRKSLDIVFMIDLIHFVNFRVQNFVFHVQSILPVNQIIL